MLVGRLNMHHMDSYAQMMYSMKTHNYFLLPDKLNIMYTPFSRLLVTNDREAPDEKNSTK